MIEGGGVLGALAAMLAGSYYTVKLQEAFHKMLASARGRAVDVSEAKRILGIDDRDCYYRSDNTHPLYPWSSSLHPDNFDALTTLTQYKVVRAEDQGLLLVADSVHGDCECDLVLVGSPTAEGCSRIVFGYTSPSDDSDSLILANPPVDLPYYWILDKRSISPNATAARFVEGKGRVRRPNWRIEGHVGAGHLYVPTVDVTEENLLCDDYLLISRVRNYLSTEALDSGKTILTFGGAHGVGTKAIDLLLRDRRLLSELGSKLTGATAYQALFRVGNIDHGPLGSRAGKIDLIDIQVLPDTDQVWRTAHNKVKLVVEQWLRSPRPNAPSRRKPQPH